MQSNVFDTALIFEGGGMRASYTCAMVNMLLEQNIFFNNVYGVSAGASNAVNYVSRDIWRTEASFTDLVLEPEFGNLRTFFQHKGLFNAPFIYQEAGKPKGPLPFDIDTFLANPARVTISGFRRDTGETVYWSNRSADKSTNFSGIERDKQYACENDNSVMLTSLDRLMLCVRASSTLPFVMPPPFIEGKAYYDGGLGEGAGLLLPRAQADGFSRFFIVRTRPKAYRKPLGGTALINAFFWRRPFVRAALATRAARYNALCDEIERLEACGQACVTYAENITAESGTHDIEVCRANYAAGYAQAQRELPRWKEFLGIERSALSAVLDEGVN